MNIITSDYIYTQDGVLENLSIAFDKVIQKIAPLEELKRDFPDTPTTYMGKNSLIMPGLVNAHVHLEFSANRETLEYGDFMTWLNSVISNRERLMQGCNKECIKNAIKMMLRSGITSYGAISSYGLDLDAVATSPQNVVYFNEVIGSKAEMADALFEDFKQRLQASKSITRENFYPAVAIHSTYSVHPILIKRALEIVNKEKLRLSAHFLESDAEKDWLTDASGAFQPFFEKFLQQSQPINSIEDFLSYFKDTPTLMTHVVKATQQELHALERSGHTVVHCPISNRLLGNGALNLDDLEKNNIRWICATDGLSSNYTLNLFEEMKIALFMHHGADLVPFAKKLIQSVTKDAADALALNTGEIKVGKNADMLVVNLPSKPNNQLPLHLLLHQYEIANIYINGKLIDKEYPWRD